MRDTKEVILDAIGIAYDFERGHGSFERYEAEKSEAIAELNAERTAAYRFALALAVLTWLHGSQEPDARAELDAWMRAGIDGANGDTMTDAIGLQYVKTWPVLIDEVSDFVPLSPEDVARLEAPQGRKFVSSAKPVNISGAFFPRPKEKP